MMYRVVCVTADGDMSRERFAEEARARGEYRHLKRVPEVLFIGLYERLAGARDFRPVRLFYRNPFPPEQAECFEVDGRA